MGFVYMVTSPSLPHVKIGYSNSRNKNSTKCRYSIMLGKDMQFISFEFLNARDMETEVHTQFGQHRIERELFDKKHADLYIEYIKKRQNELQIQHTSCIEPDEKDTCDKDVTTEEDNNIQDIHEDGVTNYKCPRCHYETNAKNKFLRHLNRLNTCLPLNSDMSIETIKSDIDEKYITTKTFVCQFCSSRLTHKRSMDHHISTLHSGEDLESVKDQNPLVECEDEIRNIPFKTNRTDLNKVNIQSDQEDEEDTRNVDTQYMCPRCHYKVNDKSKYIRHLDRSEPCPPVFSNEPPSNIKDKLIEAYLNSKPFVCEHCSTRFRYKRNHETHLRNLHPDKVNNSVNKVANEYYENPDEVQQIIGFTEINKIDTPTLPDTVYTFGNETIDHVINDTAFMEQCLTSVLTTGIPNMIVKIHFDHAYHENTNIKLKRIKHPASLLMYKEVDGNSKWMEGSADMLLKEVIIHYCGLLAQINVNMKEAGLVDTYTFQSRTANIDNVKNGKRGIYPAIKNEILIRISMQKINKKI